MSPFPRIHVYLYGPAGGPLASHFDDVADSLAQLPRLYFEPDGSLVWSGQDWQIDGMLYDRDGVVQYADLKGHAPHDRWSELCQRILQPTRPPQVGADGDTRNDWTWQLATVLSIAERSLHDLQTFEEITWGPSAKPMC